MKQDIEILLMKKGKISHGWLQEWHGVEMETSSIQTLKPLTCLTYLVRLWARLFPTLQTCEKETEEKEAKEGRTASRK